MALPKNDSSQVYVIGLRRFVPDREITWLEMEPWTLSPIGGEWPFATQARIAIVTSPYAAQCMTDAAHILPGVEFFAPGRGTAAALHRQGIETVFTPIDETSEGLLDLPGLQAADVNGQQVLVVGAQGGRGLIQSTLKARGADVTERFIYTREKRKIPEAILSQWRELRVKRPGALLVSSSNALDALLESLNPEDREALLAMRVIASSARMQSHAAALGFAAVDLAGTPDPNEMLKVIPFS